MISKYDKCERVLTRSPYLAIHSPILGKKRYFECEKRETKTVFYIFLTFFWQTGASVNHVNGFSSIFAVNIRSRLFSANDSKCKLGFRLGLVRFFFVCLFFFKFSVKSIIDKFQFGNWFLGNVFRDSSISLKPQAAYTYTKRTPNKWQTNVLVCLKWVLRCGGDPYEWGSLPGYGSQQWRHYGGAGGTLEWLRLPY